MDLKLVWNGVEMAGSWMETEEEDGLKTAILLSLFTDARAELEDELPAQESNRRGWWAEGMETAPHPFGCKWWLRWRQKQTEETAAVFADDAREALAWMITDGVVTAIDISTQWVRRGVLGFQAVFHLPTGQVETLNGEVS